ncbi:hypothetical protein C6V83_11105 [Gordonia iterans]|jgi:hypothetical protein|uniref:Uncharacterized protein n=1 Tax=Gordonia iterans TaxID=1004901 RepID=A0A2S0KGD9_9ACTN|nr:hypothetical protein [Gordonia iterans]AVM00733.1 hypothetical protein C6V83_11105 [Gordonia iterans]
MPNMLPESSEFDVRDYLYIDRERTGSLLAQLSDGLPEERSEAKSRSLSIAAGLRRVASIGKEIGENSSQTLALADLHVSQLEESATALGLLADVSDKMSKRKFWLRGKVRDSISPGMLLRVTAPTQLSDVASIAGAFRRLSTALSDSPSELEGLLGTIEALYGDSITVSVRTAVADDYEVGFMGEIPHAHEFGPMRRELLLSQVGSEPSEMTTLLQVAAIPTEREKLSPEQILAQIRPHINRLTARGSAIDRAALDQLAASLGGMLTATGFVAAPSWPAIGVVPLAIYRAVQRPSLDIE